MEWDAWRYSAVTLRYQVLPHKWRSPLTTLVFYYDPKFAVAHGVLSSN